MVSPRLRPRESHTNIARQHTGSRHASAALVRGQEAQPGRWHPHAEVAGIVPWEYPLPGVYE